MKLIIPIVIASVLVIKYIPFHLPFNPIFIPILGVMMVAVFLKGRKVIKVVEFETSQTQEELLKRNASAIETSTGVKPKTDLENNRNHWKGGSVHFFSKEAFENEND